MAPDPRHRPIAGATAVSQVDAAAKAADLILTPEEIAWLDEPYVSHPLAGVMAQNTPAAARAPHVWTAGPSVS